MQDLRMGCVESCPGCHHRSMTAAESCAQKENWIRTKLAVWNDTISPIRFLDKEQSRWHYRDKVCLNAGWNETTHTWDFGMIRRKVLIEIPDCPIHTHRANAIASILAKALPPPTDFPLHFLSMTGGQVTLVLKTKNKPPLHWLTPQLIDQLTNAQMEGLWLHLNMGCGKRVLTSKNWTLLAGRERSKTADGNHYGPASFQQVLPALYQESLDRAEEFLNPSSKSWVVDLYCGIGSSMQRWVKKGAQTVGVELNGEAISLAQENAQGATCLRGLCQDRIPQIETLTAGCDDLLLYVNPPRTGIELEITYWIAEKLRPKRMAYLSCSAGTLRKDLEVLTSYGYVVEKIIPYDFFPQTHHVETLVLLFQGQ